MLPVIISNKETSKMSSASIINNILTKMKTDKKAVIKSEREEGSLGGSVS